ncbi:zinc finger protein 189 [Thalassophryne amazonica]|uniref:zinc finger protein 189 n=1 Tax=Thalassophryne amazonica TaxID=390379 RepID=UPI0014708B30|nr:zinc finger protein 189 [Thalassophryne amazonica]XP_034027972.1 zinc finger protein 189 [Thalassophryne amazonica]
MDGVRWSTTRNHESFSRSHHAAETLSRLARFIARADAKQHTQNPKKLPYICTECGKGFPYATELLHHQALEHTLPKPHQCPSCRKTFSLKSSLHLHKCSHDFLPCELCHGESQLGTPCPACVTGTSDPDSPSEKSCHHHPRLLDSSPYTCAPCGRGFSQKQALLQHQQAGCSEPPSLPMLAGASSILVDSPPVSDGDLSHSDSSETPGPSRVTSMCHFGPTTVPTEAGLQHRKQTSHIEEQLMAPQAQKIKEEESGGDVTEGDAEVNGDPSTRTKSKQKLWSCRSCDMAFKSTTKLYVHRKEKHRREKNPRREQRPVRARRNKRSTYVCEECGEVFDHHLSILAHYRRHRVAEFTATKNENAYRSIAKDSDPDYSPNEIKTIRALYKTLPPGPGRHRKPQRFKRPGRYREVPEKEENVDREFPCPSCVEVFSLQTQLREHMELHQSSVTKIRQCSVCATKMDTRKWRSSKKRRLYHCVPCQKGFSQLDSFLEHCQDHLRVRVEEDSVTEGYSQNGNKT